MPRLALIGNRDPEITAHQAIPRALQLASRAAGTDLEWDWIGTERLDSPATLLRDAAGIWCVPGSPYRSPAGALAAIRYARENRLPFLGTCGGFQHALVEFARHVAGLPRADHEETAPASCPLTGDTGDSSPAAELVVIRLACSLVGQAESLVFTPGSRLHAILGDRPEPEGYHCSFGVNEAHRARLEAAGLRFTGFARGGAMDGAPRAVELPSHPFFVGTLFQPERAALRATNHPLVAAFVAAAVGRG